MPRRLVNLALLAVVPLLVATGLLAWVTSGATANALLVMHRVAGVGLVLVLAWKYDELLAMPVTERDAELTLADLLARHGVRASAHRGFQWMKWVGHVHVA